jgi:hypothetical protein
MAQAASAVEVEVAPMAVGSVRPRDQEMPAV